jgi:polyribonucleotide 5'-hydroxyl-kinase
MSLPGLEFSQTSAEREFVPAPPTQITLSKGSEWRFEVAFGTAIRVKVGNTDEVAWSQSFLDDALQ